MFRRVRERLEELWGAQTSFDPPVGPKNEAQARALREALTAWRERVPRRFARVFLGARPLIAKPRERDLFGALETCGCLERVGPSLYRPCVRLFPFESRFLATDLRSHRGLDQVFPLMLEQVYFVRNMEVRPGDAVLELCLGSGVNALFAADRAASVTGVDVSERALQFARFNEALNPGRVALAYACGSLFEPLAVERRFDVILVNPPFELVPEGERWFLHSDGGEDGLDVVRRLLAEAPRRLAPGGRLQMITWSPATAHGALLVDLLREAFPRHRLEVHVLDEGPLDEHIETFRRSPRFDAWRERLQARGIESVAFLFAKATPSADPRLDLSVPEAEVAACHDVMGAWG